MQQMPNHLAGRSASREDRNRVATQRVHRARDVDPAATGIVSRRIATQFVGRHNAVGRGRDVERRVHA